MDTFANGNSRILETTLDKENLVSARTKVLHDQSAHGIVRGSFGQGRIDGRVDVADDPGEESVVHGLGERVPAGLGPGHRVRLPHHLRVEEEADIFNNLCLRLLRLWCWQTATQNTRKIRAEVTLSDWPIPSNIVNGRSYCEVSSF